MSQTKFHCSCYAYRTYVLMSEWQERFPQYKNKIDSVIICSDCKAQSPHVLKSNAALCAGRNLADTTL